MYGRHAGRHVGTILDKIAPAFELCLTNIGIEAGINMREIALAIAKKNSEAASRNLIAFAIPGFTRGVHNVDAAVAIHVAQIEFALAVEFIKGRVVDPVCLFDKDAIALVYKELEILALIIRVSARAGGKNIWAAITC